MVPTVEPKFKVETLPGWDGAHKTAVDYFWDIGQLASLNGWMHKALAFWLPTRLKKGSPVQLWFTTLSSARQDEMRSDYKIYLRIIRDKYLGKRWLLEVNADFDQQAFRQTGFENESPQAFIARRIISTRMLANSDDGGPLEVFLIMRRAPIKWSTILVLENISSSEELYERVNEHYEALVDAVLKNPADTITMNNLASNLRRLGFQQNSTSSERRPPFRRANLAAVEDADLDENLAGEEAMEDIVPKSDSTDGAETLKQVYQTLKRRQRAPPRDGYPFSKNDHVTTKMGRAPPSPCKVCGSANHWDRECPDWSVYIEKQKRGVLIVISDPSERELDMLYHSAYCILLDARVAEPSL